ncbi:hypothetical protein AAAY30_01960 [Ruminococcoides bili]
MKLKNMLDFEGYLTITKQPAVWRLKQKSFQNYNPLVRFTAYWFHQFLRSHHQVYFQA